MTASSTDAQRRRKTAAFVAGHSNQDQGWLDFAGMSTGSTYVSGPTGRTATGPAGRMGSTGGVVSAGPAPTGPVNSSIGQGSCYRVLQSIDCRSQTCARPHRIRGGDGPLGARSDADTIVPTSLWSRPLQAAQTGVPTFGELICASSFGRNIKANGSAVTEERFNDWTRKFGARTARRLYYRHALLSIFDILKIGMIGALLDWIWSRFGGKP